MEESGRYNLPPPVLIELINTETSKDQGLRWNSGSLRNSVNTSIIQRGSTFLENQLSQVGMRKKQKKSDKH